MKESLKESGFPAEFAEHLDIRFCSKQTIDAAGSESGFLEQALAPATRPQPSAGAEVTTSVLKSMFLSPSSLLGFAGVLVVLFGDSVGLPEWLKWSAGVVLIVPGAISHYRQRRRRKRQFLAGLAEAAEALGFRELPDPQASLKSLGLLRARAFRGHRLSWGLERTTPAGKTILAGARAGSVGDDDDVHHHLVACWPLASSPLPDFDLRPETVAGRVASALGGQDIDFDTNPAFSARYRLRAGDEQAARRVFRPEVLNFFIRGGGDEPWTEAWHVEARDGWLIVHRPHLIAALALPLLPGFLQQTGELFDLMTVRR
jgi:hypothetical protein